MSDFAKAQLLKYGWIEGKGLGKNENGIKEALRPKLKFDTSGIGHKESDFEWWRSVYNKAANNIVLDQKTDQVLISVADENAVTISTKQGATAIDEARALYHGKFLKTSTLQDGNLVKDSTCQNLGNDDAKEVSDPFVNMTDEELFKACGGRTAHKGARHGLTLGGKLARIAEQEKKLLGNSGLKSCKKNTQVQERAKKKNKKHAVTNVVPPLDVEDNDDLVLPIPPLSVDENYKPSKTTIRKNKRKIQDLAQQLNKTCSIQDENSSFRDDEENSPQDTSEDSSLRKNKRKKKSKKKRDQVPVGYNDSDTSATCLLDDDISMEPSAKKKKKLIDSSCLHSTSVKLFKKKVYTKDTGKEARKLNAKIMKKKKKKLEKKEKKKLKSVIKPAKLKI